MTHTLHHRRIASAPHTVVDDESLGRDTARLEQLLEDKLAVLRGNTAAVCGIVRAGRLNRELFDWMVRRWRGARFFTRFADDERELAQTLIALYRTPGGVGIHGPGLATLLYNANEVALAVELCRKDPSCAPFLVRAGKRCGIKPAFFDAVARKLPRSCAPSGAYISHVRADERKLITKNAMGAYWDLLLGATPANRAPPTVRNDMRGLFGNRYSHAIGPHDMLLLARHWNAKIEPECETTVGEAFCAIVPHGTRNETTATISSALLELGQSACNADDSDASDDADDGPGARYMKHVRQAEALRKCMREMLPPQLQAMAGASHPSTCQPRAAIVCE